MYASHTTLDLFQASSSISLFPVLESNQTECDDDDISSFFYIIVSFSFRHLKRAYKKGKNLLLLFA